MEPNEITPATCPDSRACLSDALTQIPVSTAWIIIYAKDRRPATSQVDSVTLADDVQCDRPPYLLIEPSASRSPTARNLRRLSCRSEDEIEVGLRDWAGSLSMERRLGTRPQMPQRLRFRTLVRQTIELALPETHKDSVRPEPSHFDHLFSPLKTKSDKKSGQLKGRPASYSCNGTPSLHPPMRLGAPFASSMYGGKGVGPRPRRA
jgi:hypothetical protein